MLSYVVRRLALALPTLIGVTFIVFALVRFLPGDAVDILVEDYRYAPTKEAMREDLGLDKPIYEQYLSWLGGVARGDFGSSLITKRDGFAELRRTFPVSFELGLMTLAFAVVAGIPIGIISAARQNTARDYVSRCLAILALSLPSFWLATLLIVFGSRWWGYSPPPVLIHFTDDPVANLKQFAVPAAILSCFYVASIMRMTRSMMLEVLQQDYVRTALAKGLRERVVVTRHCLKNALMPVVTFIGLLVPGVLSGAVIIESIFGLPGMGRFILNAVSQRDYPMIQMLNLVIALIVVFTNLAVDVAYAYLDPRIKFQN
ncbi:MAG: ABC transporter permease [Chloroflexi bacterium]|nr:ABC transporter permease [Chloroflexota bacterium]